MESNITIKATNDEMDQFFEENSVCSVRYFNTNNNGTYEVKIRHAERKSQLFGTYTIPQLISELQPRKLTIKQLNARIRRTEEALRRERARNIEKTSNVGWSAGMRRMKVGPSFCRERELENRLDDYKNQLKKLESEK